MVQSSCVGIIFNTGLFHVPSDIIGSVHYKVEALPGSYMDQGPRGLGRRYRVTPWCSNTDFPSGFHPWLWDFRENMYDFTFTYWTCTAEYINFRPGASAQVTAPCFERAILNRLQAFQLPDRERRLWELDQKINERGIPVDVTFARNAKALADTERDRLMKELREITGLENPNSVQQMLGWLKTKGYPFESLGAKRVMEAMQ